GGPAHHAPHRQDAGEPDPHADLRGAVARVAAHSRALHSGSAPAAVPRPAGAVALQPVQALSADQDTRSSSSRAPSSASARSGSSTLIVAMPSSRAGLRLRPMSSRNATRAGATPSFSQTSA